MKNVCRLSTVDYVLRFLNCRHNGNIVEAKKAKKWLKNKLGSDFEKTLMKHGDPDAPGNFEKVRAAWESEQ